MRLLIKIGVGLAVFSIVNSWFGRVVIAAAAVYLLFDKDEKEHVK